MSETLYNTIISSLLGGGVLTAVVELFKARSERKKTEAEAEAVGVKAPLEVESMSVATMKIALSSVIEANAEQARQITSMRAEFQEQLERIRQENEGVYQSTQMEIFNLKRAFQSAEAYITILLNWVAEKLPGIKPPERKHIFTLDDRGWIEEHKE